MNKVIIVLLAVKICPTSYGQAVKLEVEGAIQIGNSTSTSPIPGTIRFNGLNFEGWNGITWVPMSKFHIISVVSDPDGNVYHAIRIGEQEWMAENLRTSKYSDGVAISLVTDNSTWTGLSIVGAYCWYNNNSVFENPYGKLYNWFAVNSGKLCPTGWRVATDSDWTTLSTFLGGLALAGGKMKEAGVAHWTNPNTAASNESSFSGLPGGYRNEAGTFLNQSLNGFWWSSSATTLPNAWYHSLNYSSGALSRTNIDRRHGFSVRCIRDIN